ncbi:MAG: ABC transporter ATP-binding protein [Propionibacteriaceae bacterium]|jgi:putative ABC transport system ATP-binding protein|nr:ABC transporter ATP-binding protein [Propionibacteriaceae bacterium]
MSRARLPQGVGTAAPAADAETAASEPSPVDSANGAAASRPSPADPGTGAAPAADAASDGAAQAPAGGATPVGRPIVEIAGLTKTYGKGEAEVTALDGVDLVVEEGTFVAVMGPSGCGKSTLLNLLGGLDTPTAGEVAIAGEKLSGLSDDQITELRRRRIGFVFQFFNLIPVLTATENASLPLRLDGDRQADAKARQWLTQVGLGERLDNRPDQLSGGQQQRVAVARALSTDPALILADEPTGNLDSKSATEIAQLLAEVSQRWGRTVLMVTHDPRIASFAHRLVLMRDGRIVGDRPLDGTREAARLALDESGLL